MFKKSFIEKNVENCIISISKMNNAKIKNLQKQLNIKEQTKLFNKTTAIQKIKQHI
jgi:hypothetical protein